MKSVFTLAFFFLSLCIFAQNKKVNFSIEGSVGATDIIFFNRDFKPLIVEDYPSNLKMGSPFLDLGGIVSIQLNKKLELQSGVKFLTQELMSKLNHLDWGNDLLGFDDVGRPIIGSATETPNGIFFIDKNYFVEIPFRLNFRMKGKLDAFRFSLGQSLTVNFFNTRQTKKFYEMNDELTKTSIEVDNSTNLRKLNSYTQVGFIWETMIFNGNYFFIFPNVRFQTLGKIKNDSLNRRHLLYGITAGVSI